MSDAISHLTIFPIASIGISDRQRFSYIPYVSHNSPVLDMVSPIPKIHDLFLLIFSILEPIRMGIQNRN